MQEFYSELVKKITLATKCRSMNLKDQNSLYSTYRYADLKTLIATRDFYIQMIKDFDKVIDYKRKLDQQENKCRMIVENELLGRAKAEYARFPDRLNDLANKFQVEPELLADAAKLHVERERMVTKELRNNEIVILASKGWTNSELSHHFGLHPSSISRIIRKRFEAGYKFPNLPSIAD